MIHTLRILSMQAWHVLDKILTLRDTIIRLGSEVLLTVHHLAMWALIQQVGHMANVDDKKQTVFHSIL